MKKFTLPVIFSFIVIVIGASVVIGWICNIAILKSILPFWVTMKFSAAVSFVLSGILLYFITDFKNCSETAQIVLPIGSLVILLLMTTFLVSTLIGIRTGIEDLFVQETQDAIKTTMPGRPSVATMIDFVLIAICGIFCMLQSKKLKTALQIIGWIVGMTGAAAAVGYVIDNSFLYFEVAGCSTAMAAHTAVLFIMMGAGLVMSGINMLDASVSTAPKKQTTKEKK